MNIAGVMWGSSDQGSFVYSDGELTLVQDPDLDVALVVGVDAAGRVYGAPGDYVDESPLFRPPIDIDSPFVWESGTFSDPNLLLADSLLWGVRQDGVFWGRNSEQAFIQDGENLTIVDHPDYDFTSIGQLTADGEAWGFAANTDGFFSSTRFVWDPLGGFEDCCRELPGTTAIPSSLNEDGVFWGFVDGSAFVATPVPQPSTALLQLGLGVGLALCRRSRSD